MKSIFKSLMICFTILTFTFATTSCATLSHTRNDAASEPNETTEATTKILAISVGVVLAVVALGFTVVYLGSKGLGQNIGGSVA